MVRGERMPLSIGVQAKFKWGNLFGTNHLECPMDCKVLINKDYYVIYVNLCDEMERQEGYKEDTCGLDVFKLFNKAFKCQWPEGILIVDQAGFFRYSKLNSNNVQQSGDNELPACMLPIPESIRQEAKMDITCFWLMVQLNTQHTPDLLKRLIDVGYKGAIEISMIAKLEQGREADEAISGMVLEANLNQMKLLDFFTFSNLRLIYACKKNKEFEIMGDIEVTVGKQDYVFHGDVKVSNQQLTAAISGGKDSAPAESLFSEQMCGLVLENVAFHLKYTFPEQKDSAHKVSRPIWWLQGTINFNEVMQFTGQLFMLGTTPLFARIMIEEYDLSIGDLFNRFVKEGTWPTHFINLVFLKGSQIYYLAEETAEMTEIDPSYNYQKGFNILAKMQITLLTTIEIIGNVSISSKGIKAAILLEHEIDLYILQIRGKNGIGGPEFSISTVDEKSMQFRGNICFFNEVFGDIGVTCGKGNDGNIKILGELDASAFFRKNLSIDEEVKLNVSYNKKDGFKIDNWPDLMSEELNIVKQLKEIIDLKGEKCSSIGDFIYEKYVKTKFHLSPKICPSEEGKEENGFKFIVGGQYVLSLGEQEIVCLNFPHTIEFTISKDISLATILKKIVSCIKDSLVNFVEDLLSEDHVAELGKLIVILSGKEVVDKVFSLLCHRTITQDTARAIIEAATTVAAELTIIETEGESAEIIGTLALITTTILNWFSNRDRGKTEEEKKREKEKREKEKEKNPDTQLCKPEPPSDFSVKCFEDQIKLSWNYAMGANGYEVFLSNGTDQITKQLIGNSINTYDIQLNSEEVHHLLSGSVMCYTVGIWSYYGSTKSTEVNFKLCRLETPELTVSYKEDTGIRAEWKSISDIKDYRLEIEVRGENTEEILQDTWYAIPQAAINNKESVTYYFRLQARSHYSWLSSKVVEKAVTIQPKIIKSLSQIVQEAYDKGEEAGICIKAVLAVYPNENIEKIAGAMRQVGYTVEQTAVGIWNKEEQKINSEGLAHYLIEAEYPKEDIIKGIKAAILSLSAEESIKLMLLIFGEPESLETLTKKLYEEHKSSEECLRKMREAYPNVSTSDMAKIMKKVGFSIQEIIQGIKSVRQDISAQELIRIMLDLDE